MALLFAVAGQVSQGAGAGQQFGYYPAGMAGGYGAGGFFGGYDAGMQQNFQMGYQQYGQAMMGHGGGNHNQMQMQIMMQMKQLLGMLMNFTQPQGQPRPHCGCGHGPKPQPPKPPVPENKGNPKEWYFQHGKYEKENTANGHVMFDANTRIEYNKDNQTGQVYKKVDGQWQLAEVRTEWGGKAASPIMLDMDGDGKADVAGGEWKPHAEKGDIGAHKVRFDLDGDGQKELTEWTGGKDGLLLKLTDEQIQNYQRDGRLEVSGRELYGDEGGKYADGYEKMRTLSDADGDGRLAGAELDSHYVWRDANRDGIVDQDELQSTAAAGITSVQATHGGDFQSAFEMNGETRKSWDWWPTTWN